MQALLPPLTDQEYQSLADSIKESGILHPIIILPNGRIIDGHHRWKIVGNDIPYIIKDMSDTEALAFGLQLNLARRQLSPEQLAEVHKKLKEKREVLMQMVSDLREQGKSQEEVAAVVGVPQQTISDWDRKRNITDLGNVSLDLRIRIPKEEHQSIHERVQSGESTETVAADYKVTPKRIQQITKLENTRQLPEPTKPNVTLLPEKYYRTIVIDPPWPVKKIQREERPDQGPHLDYPTMSLEEIKDLKIEELANPNGCHIYLWTTHKFLPTGLECFEVWNVKYQCILTWIKNVGMTPFSWMYSTEHVLFGRIGSLDLLKNGMRLDFSAKVTKHSRKPDEFYNIVRTVSPKPRLNMFARESRDEFDPWGDEADGAKNI